MTDAATHLSGALADRYRIECELGGGVAAVYFMDAHFIARRYSGFATNTRRSGNSV
jgi:hypothetical protein